MESTRAPRVVFGASPNTSGADPAHHSVLGCAHAHILFEGIEVRLKKNADGSEKEGPQSFADYEIINHWDKDCPGSKMLDLPKGVESHLRHLNLK